LQNINNNLNLLKKTGNIDIDKIVIDVKNDDIENLKSENINNIKAIDNKILNISKKYEEFITGIIKSLKSEYNNLKNNYTNNNLDIKDEEFDNLENNEKKIGNIIYINNKLKTAEQVLKGDVDGLKNDIKKLFSELTPIKEKINKIVENANSIFDLSINIEDKLNDNINDLKNIKTDLDKLKTEFYSSLNNKKRELDKRCKKLNEINEYIVTVLYGNMENYKNINFTNYDNDFLKIDEEIKKNESLLSGYLDEDLNTINELQSKFKENNKNYQEVEFEKKSDSIEDYYDHYINYKYEVYVKMFNLKYKVEETKPINYDFEKSLENIQEIISPKDEDEIGDFTLKLSISKDINKQIKEFVKFFKDANDKHKNCPDKNDDTLYNSVIVFTYKDEENNDDKTIDLGGLQKVVFYNMKEYLQNEKNELFVKSKASAQLNTVPTDDKECTYYYNFNNEINNPESNIYYEILGYIYAVSLRMKHNKMCLNLNPLIYKIIRHNGKFYDE